MKSRTFLPVVILFLILTSLTILNTGCGPSKEYTMEGFTEEINAVDGLESYIAVCRDYATHSKDIDILRKVQDFWQDIEPQEAEKFFQLNYSKNTNSAEAAYLAGRVGDDPINAIKMGHRAIEIDPAFKYGYRLILATYAHSLFNGGKDPAHLFVLDTELKNEDAVFNTVLETTPEEGGLLSFVFQYYMYIGNQEKAEEALIKARSLDSKWSASSDMDAVINASKGDYKIVHAYIKQSLEDGIKNGELPSKEKDEYQLEKILTISRKSRSYNLALEELKKWAKRAPKDKKAEIYYNLACFSSLAGNKEDAINYLNKARKTGYEDNIWLKLDPDFFALHQEPEWKETLDEFQKVWDNGAESRKKEALKSKMDIDASDFTIMDKDGNPVTLSELKGKTVVLDFWATWCGPCKRAMPELDAFTRKAPENVQVFSINVWEKSPGKAKAFIQAKDYQMKLLFGNDDLVKAYAVTGIPAIFVIGPDGKIRYRENGFGGGLEEKLTWWTESL